MLKVGRMNPGLKKAIEAVGSATELARRLSISSAAISQWEAPPPHRVLAIERETGVSRHELRPDLYPPPVASRA